MYIYYIYTKNISTKKIQKKNLLQSNQNTIHPYFYS
jgi:hypothetical protein